MTRATITAFEYHAYLISIPMDNPEETETIGFYSRLSTALVNARVAYAEKRSNQWDWFVDKIRADGSIVNRRSSLAGFEA